MCIVVWATYQGNMGKNMNVHGAVTRNEPEKTGRKRTKPEGRYGAAKTCSLHPGATRSVEGGSPEARTLKSHVYSSWDTHSTMQGTSPKPLCVGVFV